jgi:hypothetical protein
MVKRPDEIHIISYHNKIIGDLSRYCPFKRLLLCTTECLSPPSGTISLCPLRSKGESLRVVAATFSHSATKSFLFGSDQLSCPLGKHLPLTIFQFWPRRANFVKVTPDNLLIKQLRSGPLARGVVNCIPR